MPLAFSTNAFKQSTLEESIDAIARCGYAAVELMADLHHAYPLTFDATRRRDIRKRLGDLGLVVSNVNAFTHFIDGDTYHPTWIENDPARVDVRVEHTRRSIELAAEFGCRTVSIQPGGPLIGTDMTREAASQRFAEALARSVDTARSCNVIIGIEPEPGLLIQTSAEFLEFRQTFFRDEPAVKMNCDIGHLFCVGDDPATVIRSLSSHVAHVHLEDIAANRVHEHLLPGRGAIDFASIFTALRDIDYAGWSTVELYPYEATAAITAEKAFMHLKPIADRQ